MKISKIAPSAHLLDLAGHEVEMNYISHYNQSAAKRVYSYSTVAFKALQKMLQNHSFDEIHKNMIDAENKVEFDDFKTWYSMEVWLNFYNYPNTKETIKSLKNSTTRVFYPAFIDLLHYSYLIRNDSDFKIDEVNFNIKGTGLDLIFPESEYVVGNIENIIDALGKHFNVGEVIFVALLNYYTGNAIMAKELKPINITFNGSVYLALMELYQRVEKDLLNISHSNKEASLILKDWITGKLPASVSQLVNVSKLFKITANEPDEIDEQTSKSFMRARALFSSDMPSDNWIDLVDLPTYWIEQLGDN
jgi:hypothetical protein